MWKEKRMHRLEAICGAMCVVLGVLLIEYLKNSNIASTPVHRNNSSSVEMTPTPLPAGAYNGDILRPTVVAYEELGVSTNFYPDGPFTQELFNQVKSLVFRMTTKTRSCTATLIDDEGDPSGAYFVSAKHCSEIGFTHPWFFINPDENSLTYDVGNQEKYDPNLDLMVVKFPNYATVRDINSAPVWNEEYFTGGIPLASSGVISGERVLVLGYPGASFVSNIVGGEDVNLASSGFPDAVLLSAYAKVVDDDAGNPEGGIKLESEHFQSLADGHSGCPVFKIEDGRLVLVAVVYGTWRTNDEGKTEFMAAPISTVRTLIAP